MQNIDMAGQLICANSPPNECKAKHVKDKGVYCAFMTANPDCLANRLQYQRELHHGHNCLKTEVYTTGDHAHCMHTHMELKMAKRISTVHPIII